jgi:hypothetical protein
MNTNPTDSFFQIAENLLMIAEHEQERADEDVVTHLICSHSRQSIINFLTGYLRNKNIPIDQPTTIASLQQQCQAIDARFEELSLEDVQCRFELHDRYYCLEHDHVDACLKTAQHVRSIVLEDTPGY